MSNKEHDQNTSIHTQLGCKRAYHALLYRMLAVVKEMPAVRVSAFVFLQAMFVLSLYAGNFVSDALEGIDAITFPWGTVYFEDDPEQFLVEHEECHVDQIRAEGALQFYVRYATGDACKIEVACGYPDEGPDIYDHPACELYPPGYIARSDSATSYKPGNVMAQVAHLKQNVSITGIRYYASVR